jgi:hypothetical protein
MLNKFGCAQSSIEFRTRGKRKNNGLRKIGFCLTKNKFDFNFDFNLILIYFKLQNISQMNDLSTNPIIDILSSPQELRNICNDFNLKSDHSFDLTMALNLSPKN